MLIISGSPRTSPTKDLAELLVSLRVVVVGVALVSGEPRVVG